MKHNQPYALTESSAGDDDVLDMLFRQHLRDELSTPLPQRVRTPVVSSRPIVRYNTQPLHAVYQIQIAGFRLLTFVLQSACTAGQTIPG